MNTLENNKLIAEFMGAIITDNNTVKNYTEISIPQYAFKEHDFDTLKVGSCGYDRSWDWLMPVVEKVENLDISEGDFDAYIEIYADRCSVIAWHGEILAECIALTKIEATYLAVVNFIKWYNNYQIEQTIDVDSWSNY